MTKPLSYYSLDYKCALIQDIADTWGDNLEKLEHSDRYCLIDALAEHYLLQLGVWETNAARECYDRLDELDTREHHALLLALGNKSRGQCLGYWGMPPASYEKELIIDIICEWGDNLQGLEESDQMFLIAALATKIWVEQYQSCLEEPEACFEARDRLEELPREQIYFLVRALINK